ncbi:MAG: LamG domain-containing protein [Chloroflexi bacterium]|nr:LamG domain-containing protein [Chloroflexota bacterium]
MRRRSAALAVLAVAVAACDAVVVAPSVEPATCTIAVQAVDGPGMEITGSGFPPDEPVFLTVGVGDRSATFSQTTNPALRTDVRGVVLFGLGAGREDIGTSTVTLSAGGCTASASIVIDASAFPPACPAESPVAGPAGDAYRAGVLADEPIAYWRFEDVEGPILAAEVGDPAALIGNGVLGQAGAMAGSAALGLRGEGGVAITPLPLARDFTVEAWMLLCEDGIDAGDGLFASSEGSPNVNFFNAAPRLWTGTEDLVWAGDGFLEHGRWYHFALVRDAGRVTLVIDGRTIGSAPFTDPIELARLGDSGDGTTFGQLDEFAVHDRALTVEDLAARRADAR